MVDNHNHLDVDRRTVLKSIGVGAFVTGATRSVTATTDDSTHYHNELYGPHFPDPTIHRADDGTWWAYGTNMNRENDSDERLVPILSSPDLVDWTYEGEAFTERPGWTYGSLWAPDIHYYDGEWVMFYSLEPRPWESGEFGIGLAKSDTPDGPFTDYGQVIGDNDTGGGTIDGYFVEYEGTPYLFWGSFQGIYVAELTPDLQDYYPSTTVQVAGDAYEGANVFYRNGYWYLFLATGTCCDGYSSTYEVEVGRSTDFFGPYYDPSGTDMMQYNEHNAGIAQFTSNERFQAPAHGDVTIDDDGNYWFVCHAYDTDDQEFVDGVPARQFFLDRIEWTDDDWPVIGGDKTPSLQSIRPNSGGDSPVIADGIYEIVNANSGKPMEVANASTDDGANVRQWSANNCACQRWWVEHVGSGEYRIVNQNSTKALDVTDGSTDPGASLQQWTWWAGGMQKWYVVDNGDGTFRLENVNSGHVAEVTNGATTDGADIVQAGYQGTANQQWEFEFVETVSPTDDGRPW